MFHPRRQLLYNLYYVIQKIVYYFLSQFHLDGIEKKYSLLLSLL